MWTNNGEIECARILPIVSTTTWKKSSIKIRTLCFESQDFKNDLKFNDLKTHMYHYPNLDSRPKDTNSIFQYSITKALLLQGQKLWSHANINHEHFNKQSCFFNSFIISCLECLLRLSRMSWSLTQLIPTWLFSLTVYTSEAISTITCVPIHFINTCATMLAWCTGTFIDVYITISTRPTSKTVTDSVALSLVQGSSYYLHQ